MIATDAGGLPSGLPLRDLPGWAEACADERRTLTYVPADELEADFAEVGEWIPPATVKSVSASMVASLRHIMMTYRDPPWERPANVFSLDAARYAQAKKRYGF